MTSSRHRPAAGTGHLRTEPADSTGEGRRHVVGGNDHNIRAGAAHTPLITDSTFSDDMQPREILDEGNRASHRDCRAQGVEPREWRTLGRRQMTCLMRY